MNYTPLRRYYRGHNLVGMRDVPAGTTRYYHFDHQGTTQCLTNEQGQVTDRFASDAWGVQIKRLSGSINRQWYIGSSGYYRQVDEVLDYVRQRWLDPHTGTWILRDFLPTEAPYTYVENRPTVNIDPEGLQGVTFPGGCIITTPGKYCDYILTTVMGSCNVSWRPSISTDPCISQMKSDCNWLSTDLMCEALENGNCCGIAAQFNIPSECLCALSLAEQSYAHVGIKSVPIRCKNACQDLAATCGIPTRFGTGGTLGCLQRVRF